MTAVVDPAAPPPVANNTDGRNTDGGTCWCGGADELIALMTETGMDQWAASRVLWPPEPLAPVEVPMSRMAHTERKSLTVEIHARFHAWFPWLRGCCEVTS